MSHAATLTGAPMNLLHLLRWIRRHTDVEVHTLVLEPGPLVARFGQCGDVSVVEGVNPGALLGLSASGLLAPWARQVRRTIAHRRLASQVGHLRGFDLAYLNSAMSIVVAPKLPRTTAVVSHVHELAVALRTFPAQTHRLLRNVPDGWIAASAPVRDVLVEDLALARERVLVRDEFIAARDLTERVVSLREVEACRRELGISADPAIVLGSGTLDWRKGVDLFVQLATEVRRRSRRPVQFVWLGGQPRGLDWERVRSDRDRAGANHLVHFAGEREDPVPWLAMADVFALTSREDPLPLVALESAALGVPIVSYRNGGLPGFLEAAGPDAAAGVVDHLDVGTMAARVLALLDDDRLRKSSAEQARARVVEHHDVGVVAPRLLTDLEVVLASKSGRR